MRWLREPHRRSVARCRLREMETNSVEDLATSETSNQMVHTGENGITTTTPSSTIAIYNSGASVYPNVQPLSRHPGMVMTMTNAFGLSGLRITVSQDGSYDVNFRGAFPRAQGLVSGQTPAPYSLPQAQTLPLRTGRSPEAHASNAAAITWDPPAADPIIPRQSGQDRGQRQVPAGSRASMNIKGILGIALGILLLLIFTELLYLLYHNASEADVVNQVSDFIIKPIILSQMRRNNRFVSACESPNPPLPEVNPICWTFEGSDGDVVIKLPVPAVVTGFTLEHIPKAISRYDGIDSAPKEFMVLGLPSAYGQIHAHFYGHFQYEHNGELIQYFPAMTNATTKMYPILKLKILSNHGNLHRTLIYGFRVHGVIDQTHFNNEGTNAKSSGEDDMNDEI